MDNNKRPRIKESDIPDTISAMTKLEKALTDNQEIFTRQRETISAASQAGLEALAKVMRENLSSYEFYINAMQTAMIDALRACTLSVDVQGMAVAALETMNASQIAASDIGFLRASSLGKELFKAISDSLPPNISTELRHLNLATAEYLQSSDKLQYDTEKKMYYIDKQVGQGETAYIKTRELNIITNAAYTIRVGFYDVAEDKKDFVTEDELVDFMTFLDEHYSFGAEHVAGRKILDMIDSVSQSRIDITRVIGFDHGVFFHGRARKADDAPYTRQDMLRSPRGVTGPGRFNLPWQACYYFADTPEGVKREVKRRKDEECQIMRLRPIGSARLLDLSTAMSRGRAFLKYIRFANKSNDMMPREYLIPCYVAECCKRVGLDGIKYYGGKDYSNYVVWDDGYFESDGMETI